MSLGIQERIPERISADLDPRYTTDYHPDSAYRWEFDPAALNPLVTMLVDVEKLFIGAQRWKTEAVSMIPRNTDGVGYPLPLLSIHVVLRTEKEPPTKREWFIKPPFIRTQLDLRQVLRNVIGQNAEVQYHGSKRDLFIDTDIPQLGPFGPGEDFEKAKTPYFIRRIGLHPFYYYKNSRETIAGENSSRIFLAVDLLDGRVKTQNAIDSKLGEHNKELTAAGTAYFRQQLVYKYLRDVTKEELVGNERKFLQDLNARPDPLKQLVN